MDGLYWETQRKSRSAVRVFSRHRLLKEEPSRGLRYLRYPEAPTHPHPTLACGTCGTRTHPQRAGESIAERPVACTLCWFCQLVPHRLYSISVHAVVSLSASKVPDACAQMPGWIGKGEGQEFVKMTKRGQPEKNAHHLPSVKKGRAKL